MKIRPIIAAWSARSLVVLALPLVMALSAAGQTQEELAREVNQLRSRLEELEKKLQQNQAAQPPVPTNITETVNDLDQKVRVLERNRELEREEAEAKAKTTPVLKVGENGVSLESGNGDFRLRLQSLLQVDSRLYADDPGVTDNDTFLIRRARIEFTGNVFKNFEYRLLSEFAGSSTTLLEYWLRWNIDPRFQLFAGKTKLPVSLERAQSIEHVTATEFGYPTSLAPNRDIGIGARGAFFNGAFDYYAGVFNGVPDGGVGTTDTDDEKTLAGRLFTHPFLSRSNALSGLGFGVGGTYGVDEGAPGGYRTVGQQSLFSWNSGVARDGETWRIVPQFYYYYGPFGLLGEYAVSSQELRRNDDFEALANTGWHLTASYVLTGEDATYRGVKPRRPFRFGSDGGWGALQVFGRVTELDIDDDAFPTFANIDRSASEVRSFGGGLNWYLNNNVRFTTDYHYSDIEGGSLRDEHAIISRVQLRF